MSAEEFEAAKHAMDIGQKDIYNIVLQQLKAQANWSTQRLCWFVTGGAGVGKTFLFTI